MSRSKGKTKAFSEYRNGMRPKIIGFKENTYKAITTASSTNWREFKNFVEHFLDQVAMGNIKYRLPGTTVWADINCGELGIIPSHEDGAFCTDGEQEKLRLHTIWLGADKSTITDQHMQALFCAVGGYETTPKQRKWKVGRKSKLRIKIKDESKQHGKGQKLLTAQRDELITLNIGFKEHTFNTLTKAGEKNGRNLKSFVEHLLDQFASGHVKYRVPGTDRWVDIYTVKAPTQPVPVVELPVEAMQSTAIFDENPIADTKRVTVSVAIDNASNVPIVVLGAENTDSDDTIIVGSDDIIPTGTPVSDPTDTPDSNEVE